MLPNISRNSFIRDRNYVLVTVISSNILFFGMFLFLVSPIIMYYTPLSMISNLIGTTHFVVKKEKKIFPHYLCTVSK